MSRISRLFFATAAAAVFWCETPLLQAGTTLTVAPDWRLNDPDGKSVQLSDFKGKVVILDFWATWCPPCRAEIPGFVALQKEYGDRGLAVVGVSLDTAGPSVVKTFGQRLGMNYPIVMGNETIADNYGGVSVIPTTFVIDRNGNIIASHQGFTSQADFESEVRLLLERAKTP
jgi:thiol-disulfide isomerase/thioredoxin